MDARKCQRVPGLKRERQREREKARECQNGPERARGQKRGEREPGVESKDAPKMDPKI